MDDLESLYSWASLISLQGSTAATLLFANVLGYLVGESFTPYRKWVALFVAVLLQLLAAAFGDASGAEVWIVALLNGLLVFASAIGLNQMNPAARRAADPTHVASAGPNRLVASWV